jgi:hypothetical protein
MFDTVKFCFFATSKLRLAIVNGGGESTQSIAFYRSCFYIKHPFGFSSIRVNFCLDLKKLWLELSIPKLLQGHNVFGCNKMEYLCISTIEFIYRKLGVDFDACEKKLVLYHRIRLSRVDVTCSFSLECQDEVENVLESVLLQCRAENLKWSAYGRTKIQSVYNQINSSRVTDKFYNKSCELFEKRRGLPASVIERESILDFSRSLLRFEVTLRGKELAGRELEYADCWTPSMAKGVLQARLSRFHFGGAIKSSIANDNINELNDSCYMFYGLWAEGANLNKHRYNRTLQRARDKILADWGVDIYRPTGSVCPRSLKDLLHPDRAYYSAPKSLVRRGAIFGMG